MTITTLRIIGWYAHLHAHDALTGPLWCVLRRVAHRIIAELTTQQGARNIE